MLILPVEESKEGMKLAAPVMNPEAPSQELLHQGYILEAAVIEKLREMQIEFIYVDYPALDSHDRHILPNLSEERQAVYGQIKQSIGDVQTKTRPGVPYNDYKQATGELITTLLTQGQNPVYMDQMSRQGKDAVSHAASVAHLALLLGLRLEPYIIGQRPKVPPRRAKEIVNLGVAAMLHDIGLSALPEHLQNICETQPPEDEKALAEWKTHAQIGYEMLRTSVEATAAAAVYQHHQHYDGTGFPTLNRRDGTQSTLAQNRIHIFARIILCANLYDRLASPPGRRGVQSNVEIHRQFETRYAGWYDPEVFRTLQAITPPYPPGMRVRLSDGARAIVMEVPASAPGKPIVKRLADDGWTMIGESVDLRLPGAPEIESASECRLAA